MRRSICSETGVTTTLRELESNGSASKTCELSEILGTDIALYHLEVVVDGLG